MTFQDWLDTVADGSLPVEFQLATERKLHLLTAALLRRVWDVMPSHHSQTAVEATERFADGLITADSLAWTRSQAARESGEQVWFAGMSPDEYFLLEEWDCDPGHLARRERYAWRVARQGGILDGVRHGVQHPAVVARGAAFYVFLLEHPHLRRTTDPSGWCRAWLPLYRVAVEVLGPDDATNRFSPSWQTSDVVALARGVYADQDFDQLPILADALQDAGCTDETVLRHCREPGHHVRGCWVVDLARGAA